MKMTPGDFLALEASVRAVLVARPNARADYRAYGLSDERFRWDVLRASKHPTAPLYKYLSDAHIDTALRAIIGAE